MSIVDDIQMMRHDAHQKNLTPYLLIISVPNLIELNAQLGYIGGKADSPEGILSMIECYLYGSVFGLNVPLGKRLQVVAE